MFQEQTPQASYYIQIPGFVFMCDEIEQGAKLLYGLISALTKMEKPYCWASNKYFAEKFKVDESTIKRWLESLQNNNFIKIETEKKGVLWDRKIYIFEVFSRNNYEGSKMTLRESKNDPSKAQKCPHSNISNIAKERDSSNAPPPKPPPQTGAAASKGKIKYTNPKGKLLEIDESEIYSYFLKKPFATEIIQEAIEIAINEALSVPIGNIYKFLEAICLRLANNIKSNVKSFKEATPKEDCAPPFYTGPIGNWGEMFNKKE